MVDQRSDMPGAGDRGIEQSLSRASAVLSVLSSAADDGMRFTDIVRATGLSKATAHRLLAALLANDFIEQDMPSQRYFVGLRLAAWAAAARNRFRLAERAWPMLQALCDATEDTVYLGLRSGDWSVCVARLEGSFPIRTLTLRVGDRSPLGVGSGALALLAFLPAEAERQRVLADPDQRAARAQRGVADETVRRWIAVSQKQGVAESGELVPGMTALSLPLLDAAGWPVAAVSVAGISSRFAAPRREATLARMRDAVAQMQESLAPLLRRAGGAG